MFITFYNPFAMEKSHCNRNGKLQNNNLVTSDIFDLLEHPLHRG